MKFLPKRPRCLRCWGTVPPTWLLVVGTRLTLGKLWLVGKNTSRASEHAINGSQTLKFHEEIYHKGEKNRGVGSRHEKINPNLHTIYACRASLSTLPPSLRNRRSLCNRGSKYTCECWSSWMQRLGAKRTFGQQWLKE